MAGLLNKQTAAKLGNVRSHSGSSWTDHAQNGGLVAGNNYYITVFATYPLGPSAPVAESFRSGRDTASNFEIARV